MSTTRTVLIICLILIIPIAIGCDSGPANTRTTPSARNDDTVGELLDSVRSIQQELVAIRQAVELQQDLLTKVADSLKQEDFSALPHLGAGPSLNYNWEDLRDYAESWKLAQKIADYRWKLAELISKLNEDLAENEDQNLGSRIDTIIRAKQELDVIRTFQELREWKEEFHMNGL